MDAGVLCRDVVPDSRLAFLERNSMEKRGNQIKLIFTALLPQQALHLGVGHIHCSGVKQRLVFLSVFI